MKQNHWSFTKQQLADSQLDSAMDITSIRRNLYDNFYGELEVIVCNIMAAGVPVSDMRLSTPYIDEKGSIYTLNCNLMFRGIHFI